MVPEFLREPILYALAVMLALILGGSRKRRR